MRHYTCLIIAASWKHFQTRKKHKNKNERKQKKKTTNTQQTRPKAHIFQSFTKHFLKQN